MKNKDTSEAWDEVEKEGEVSRCIFCNKKIWIYWKMKKKWEMDYERMNKCAPCYFK